MKRLCFFVSLFVLAGLAGCKQFEVMEPEVRPEVYFKNSKNNRADPDAEVAFKYLGSDVKARLVMVGVCLVGDASNEPRRVPVKQALLSGTWQADAAVPFPANEPDLSKAKAFGGTIEAHYVSFDHPNIMDFIQDPRYELSKTEINTNQVNVAFVDPKGPYHGQDKPSGTPLNYPVIILRDPSLDPNNMQVPPELGEGETIEEYYVKHPRVVRMQLYANSDFSIKRASQAVLDNTAITDKESRIANINYYISISDVFSKPSTWDQPEHILNPTPLYWAYHFGAWSSKKMDLISRANGDFTNWELKQPERDFPEMNEFAYMKKRAQELIAAILNDPNNPSYDWIFDNIRFDPVTGEAIEILDENGNPITL